jgi:hypothetical protein
MGSDSIDEADLGLAAAVQLQRAGRWDLALAALPVEPVGRAADLRAEILVDRHLWRLDAVDEAEAAITVVEAGGNLALAGLLRGQLLYWRMLFSLGPAPDGAGRAAGALTLGAAEPRLQGWATFWLGVLADNILKDRTAAAERYALAARFARTQGDRLLESYTARHQGFHLLTDGDRNAGVELLRRSLQLRASVGAVPQVAAAQAVLGEALPPGAERSTLLELALATARDLQLTWLRRGLDEQGPPGGEQGGAGP